MTPSPIIEPVPRWWESSALTAAPSLLTFRRNALEQSDKLTKTE